MISVVTITKNNSVGLKRTLSSLSKLKFKPLEIIVQDNMSTDETKSIVFRYSDSLNIKHFIENLNRLELSRN